MKTNFKFKRREQDVIELVDALVPATDRKVKANDNVALISDKVLQHEHTQLQTRAEDLQRRADAQPERITNGTMQGRMQDLIKEIDVHVALIEKTRATAKAPFLTAGRVVDGFFKDHLLRPLKTARERLADIGQDYLERKAERARVRLGERESRNTKTADLARTRSAVGGSVGTLEDVWDYEVTDAEALRPEQLWDYVSAEAKEAAIRAYIRINAPKQHVENWNPLAGVRMIPVSRAKYY